MPTSPTRSIRVIHAALALALSIGAAGAQVYTPLELTVGQTTRVSVDLADLRQGIDPTTVSTTPTPTTATVEYAGGADFDLRGIAEGEERVDLRYCDATGACDTARFALTTRLPRAIERLTIYDTVGVPGSVKTFCLDTTEVPGVITTVRDLCAGPAREFVEFTLTERTRCVKYRGLRLGGTDSTCLVLCDDLGFCDTTVIVVTTQQPTPFPPQTLEFTIDRGTSDRVALDVSAFAQRPTELVDECPGESGNLVAFTLDAAALEVTFDGLEVGTERACVLAKAPNGTSQRFDITVHVVTRSPGVDTLRVPLGQTSEWCFGEYELVGDPIGLVDLCPAAAPVTTTATTADVTCLAVSGTAVGTQDMCLNLCDDTNRCDVVDLHVIVFEEAADAPPVANDDVVTLTPVGAGRFVILGNDLPNGTLTSVTIVAAPLLGTATLDAAGELEYVRDADADCGDDMLVYEICNAAGCDRATVTLEAVCEGVGGRGPIVVTQSLSPNDDGIGDRWIIRNILDYPDNEVKVYNRWGSRVFRGTGYANDWGGTFEDGRPLPDGTYFYVVVVEGELAEASYLELRR